MKSIDSDTGACDCARGNAERGMACTAARGVKHSVLVRNWKCPEAVAAVSWRQCARWGQVGGEVRMRGDCVCVCVCVVCVCGVCACVRVATRARGLGAEIATA